MTDNQPQAGRLDDEDEMAASRRYTLAEAAGALGVHLVTLQRWMRTEGMEPDRDPRDRRFKWLSEGQVERIGRLHRRPLRPEPRHEHVYARLADQERRIEELERRLDELEAGRAAGGVRAVVPTQDVLVEPLEPFEPRPPRSRSQTRPLGTTSSLDEVPPGWVPLSRFAQEIGIPRWTITDHVRAGHLSSHRGAWHTRGPNKVRTTEILDPDEQEAIRRYFSK